MLADSYENLLKYIYAAICRKHTKGVPQGFTLSLYLKFSTDLKTYSFRKYLKHLDTTIKSLINI